ncbi:Glycosyltransferase [Richelia intracellularis HM01]|nr:Glycosyltransferase [Richelia intracellularis HM01]
MRAVDIEYSQGPDLYIANSHIVSKRIQNIYGKPTIVINFPIDTSKFIFSEKKDEYYLAAARMISYKRLDIIVEAFNWLGWRLLISGNGPEKERLQSKALGNIEFLGHTTDDKRAQLFAHAKSIIVTALEDYGLVPIEANASGTPVIAYGKGGVLDTQIPDKTGVLFSRQTPDSLQNALLRGKAINWDYQQIRNHAVANFSEEKFFRTVEQVVTSTCR